MNPQNLVIAAAVSPANQSAGFVQPGADYART
jgi:hypothetical protein